MPDPENHSSPELQDSHEQDDAIQSPHDRLVSLTLQQIDAARSLIENYLPHEWVQYLKLDTLAPADTSLIDRNLRRSRLTRN